MKPIYQVVEDVRKSKGVTKSHIAKHCKRSVSWYSDISKGKIRLNVDDLMIIADVLNENVIIFFTKGLSVTRNERKEEVITV